MHATAVAGLGWSQELGTKSRSPHEWQGSSHLHHHLLSFRVHIHRKLECQWSWDLNPIPLTWNLGIPSSFLTAIPSTCPLSYYFSSEVKCYIFEKHFKHTKTSQNIVKSSYMSITKVFWMLTLLQPIVQSPKPEYYLEKITFK